jgi:hypothetical protein
VAIANKIKIKKSFYKFLEFAGVGTWFCEVLLAVVVWRLHIE